jgi:hypothetical protein
VIVIDEPTEVLDESAEEEEVEADSAQDEAEDGESAAADEPATDEAAGADSGYATVAAADEPVAAVSVDGQYGYINTSGQWVIAPQYARASPFADNIAAVSAEGVGAWKLIDKASATIAEFPADIIIDMRNYNRYDTVYKGAAIVEGMIIIARDASGYAGEDSRYGFANVQGEIVVDPQYAQVEPFNDGLAAVNFGTRAEPNWGFIDPTGQVVIQPAYYSVKDFSDGLAYVEKDANNLSDEDRQTNTWRGFIDHTGALVIHPQWDETGIFVTGFLGDLGQFSDDRAVVSYSWPYVDEFGLNQTASGIAIIDKSANVLFKTTDYSSNPTYGFSEGLYTISGTPDSDGNAPTGFMDAEGNIVIATQSAWKVEYARMFSDGMCAVYTQGMIGFIDPSGNLAIPTQYWGARDYTFGLAAISTEDSGYGGWQYIDKAGNVAIAGEFNDAWPFSS